MNGPAEDKYKHHSHMYLRESGEWSRERRDSAFEDNVFFTDNGCIGIECGGRVVVKSIETWMELARSQSVAKSSSPTIVKNFSHLWKEQEQET